MNELLAGARDSRGGDALGSIANAAPAQFTVGEVGFGASWTVEDSMAASIIRLEQELAEAKATIESLRDALCSYKCADKAAADGGWANI